MPDSIDPAVCDVGNGLLAEQPAALTTSRATFPGGQRLVVTVRTATTTLTVLLPKDEALKWAAQIGGEARQMSAAGLYVPGNGQAPGP